FEVEVGQLRITDAHIRFAPGLANTEADFAIVGDLPAYMQAIAIALQAVFGDGVVIHYRFDILVFGVQVWRHEPARAGIQRLIEFGKQLLMIAQLYAGQPFGAQFIDTVFAIAGADIEGTVTAEVVREVDT